MLTRSGPPELLLLLEELELEELELLADKPPLLLEELLLEVLLEEPPVDDELLELLVGFTPPLLSPESFELHAASNNEHINTDKILGTAILQATLTAQGITPGCVLLLPVCYAFMDLGYVQSKQFAASITFNLKTAGELVARVPKALNMGAFLSKFGESSSHHYGESNFDKKAC